MIDKANGFTDKVWNDVWFVDLCVWNVLMTMWECF